MTYLDIKNKEQVKQLQLDLQKLNFDIGRFGADGAFGKDTKGAIFDFCEEYGIDEKLIAGNNIPLDIVSKLHDIAETKRDGSLIKPASYFDYTDIAFTGPRKKVRPWTDIKGVLWHQAGCLFFPLNKTPNHKRVYDFQYVNEEGQNVRTSLKAHVLITLSGEIIQVHPFTSFIWSAQGGSHNFINVEVDGNHAGAINDPATYPGGSKAKVQRMTNAQIGACHQFYNYAQAIVKAKVGHDFTEISTHRPWTDDRTFDCGEEIFKEVILPLKKAHNLKLDARATSGRGEQLPDSWTMENNGIKLY